MSLKIGENVSVSNSLDLDEKQSYSASYPDPSCLHMAQVVLGGLRIDMQTGGIKASNSAADLRSNLLPLAL